LRSSQRHLNCARTPAPTRAEKRAEAKVKGYADETCGECGNFTLVRNGTCLKLQHLRGNQRFQLSRDW